MSLKKKLTNHTVAQLKKLWANMKQSQREVLTKERQARLSTGGGPPPSDTKIDPDIALITPHLLKTAPVLFSSNMSESDINDNEERIINALKDSDVTTILCNNSNDADMTRNAEMKILKKQATRRIKTLLNTMKHFLGREKINGILLVRKHQN
ncbi:uncharacterized protein LOC143902059 isoform X3 [Temnothorax americanus]|uniref:uncharacterized protein LOC143902059 isoform X3 n=1 Tax=Temnothorax americanus TaxID=1964332 RepID=UPI00406874DA